MASPCKIPTIGEIDQEDENTEIQVDFEARIPEEVDFEGIHKLLQQVFLKTPVDLTAMTDSIMNQKNIGSVLKQVVELDEDDCDSDEEEDRHVFSVSTVLNLSQMKECEWVQQLKLLLTRQSGVLNADSHQKFKDVINDGSQQVGLLVNERFINIPPQVAVPCFESLWKEIDKTSSRDASYDMRHLLIICKTYKALDTDSKLTTKDVEFVNEEEKYFFEERSVAFNYSVKEERDTVIGGSWDGEDIEMEPLRTVILMPYKKIPNVMSKIKGLI